MIPRLKCCGSILLIVFLLTAAVRSAELNGKVMTAEGRAVPGAIVYAESGPDLDSIATPQEKWKLQGRRLIPQVFVARAEQPLVVSNEDPLGYTLFIRFNQGDFQSRMLKPAKQTEFLTGKPELFARATDDLNGIYGHVCVLKHLVYAMTDEEGKFQFGNLPPGKYTFGAAHLREGRTTGEVTIGQQNTSVDFTLPGRKKAEMGR
ncbi:MAG: hypothetical protein ACK4UN_08475 [Limisphaerales bacterium]